MIGGTRFPNFSGINYYNQENKNNGKVFKYSAVEENNTPYIEEEQAQFFTTEGQIPYNNVAENDYFAIAPGSDGGNFLVSGNIEKAYIEKKVTGSIVSGAFKGNTGNIPWVGKAYIYKYKGDTNSKHNLQYYQGKGTTFKPDLSDFTLITSDFAFEKWGKKDENVNSEIQKQQRSLYNIEEEEFNEFKNGEGKFLELRVGLNKQVKNIIKELGKDGAQKDNLFENSIDWKVARNKQIEVNNNIKLIPDNFVFKSGFKYTLGEATEVTNSGPFKIINNLAGGFAMADAIVKSAKDKNSDVDKNYKERVNIYRNTPYFKDMDMINIDNLSFTFNWGQYGLYNCEEEVVKPILKLASLFSYGFSNFDADDDVLGDSIDNTNKDKKVFVSTPFSNKFTILTQMYSSLLKNSAILVRDFFDAEKDPKAVPKKGEKSNKETIISSIKSIPESMTNLVNMAAQSVNTSYFMIKIGASIFGPYYISGCNWEFNYERTDEKGLPFNGTINFSGIKSLLLENIEGLFYTGGQIYSVPKEDENNTNTFDNSTGV